MAAQRDQVAGELPGTAVLCHGTEIRLEREERHLGVAFGFALPAINFCAFMLS